MAKITQLRVRLARTLASSQSDPFSLRRGLTLVELSIVILVLGVLMVVVYGSLPRTPEREVWRLQIQQQARSLPLQLRAYEERHGRLAAGDSLAAIVDSGPTDLDSRVGAGENGALDPWRRPYFICLDENDRRHICTYGADGLPGGAGTDADIYLTARATTWPVWLNGSAADDPERDFSRG